MGELEFIECRKTKKLQIALKYMLIIKANRGMHFSARGMHFC